MIGQLISGVAYGASVVLTCLRFIKLVDGLLSGYLRVFQVWKGCKNISEDFEFDTCVCV